MEENQSSKGLFRPAFNAPPLFGQERFDFESTDSPGNFSTPEGTLRSIVLTSTSSSHVTVAREAPNPVHGVSGLAGVGKTTALKGIAHDQKILR